MDLSHVKSRLSSMPVKLVESVALAQAQVYLNDPKPLQSREAYIQGISKTLGIDIEMMEWAFDMASQKAEQKKYENTKRQGKIKKDR